MDSWLGQASGILLVNVVPLGVVDEFIGKVTERFPKGFP